MFRRGLKRIKQPARESFHTEFQFRPYHLYKIISSDDKWVLSIKKPNADGSEDLNVYLVPNDVSKLPSDFKEDRQYVFIDSDTGAISFFQSVMPYLNSRIAPEAVNVTHSDSLQYQSLYIFDNNGAIKCKDNNEYYLGVQTIPDGATELCLQVMHKSLYDKAAIKTWKYVLQFDCRDLYNEHITMLENSKINDTADKTIEELKNLNAAYLRRADIELNYRDEYIKKYESNWFVKTFMNSGETPGTAFVDARTFAKTTTETPNSATTATSAANANKESYPNPLLPSFKRDPYNKYKSRAIRPTQMLQRTNGSIQQTNIK